MPHKRNTKNDCQHIDAAGRRCRMLRSKHHDTYCLSHAQKQQLQQARVESQAVADKLLAVNTDFDSAIAIHETLGNLFNLAAQDRISARKATCLAYIAQLLIGTLPSMRREASAIAAHAEAKRLADLRDAKAAQAAAEKAAAEKAAAETFRQTPHAPSAKDDGRSSQDGHTAAAEAPKSAPPAASPAASPVPRPWPVPITNTGNNAPAPVSAHTPASSRCPTDTSSATSFAGRPWPIGSTRNHSA